MKGNPICFKIARKFFAYLQYIEKFLRLKFIESIFWPEFFQKIAFFSHIIYWREENFLHGIEDKLFLHLNKKKFWSKSYTPKYIWPVGNGDYQFSENWYHSFKLIFSICIIAQTVYFTVFPYAEHVCDVIFLIWEE